MFSGKTGKGWSVGQLVSCKHTLCFLWKLIFIVIIYYLYIILLFTYIINVRKDEVRIYN